MGCFPSGTLVGHTCPNLTEEEGVATATGVLFNSVGVSDFLIRLQFIPRNNLSSRSTRSRFCNSFEDLRNKLPCEGRFPVVTQPWRTDVRPQFNLLFFLLPTLL